MQAILSVTVPFFALVPCGYLAARARFLPESAIPGLNGFVLFFALPCMLFRFGASLPVWQLLDPAVLAVYAASMLVIVFGTVAVTRSVRVRMKDAAFGALSAAFPNSGFMGLPLLAALLGPQAAGPVISTLLVDQLATSSLCIAMAQADDHAGSLLADTARSLRSALSNPLPWAIALGMAASFAQFALPGPIDTVVKMLADAATPVALFTIGTVLWRAGAHVHAHSRTPPSLLAYKQQTPMGPQEAQGVSYEGPRLSLVSVEHVWLPDDVDDDDWETRPVIRYVDEMALEELKRRSEQEYGWVRANVEKLTPSDEEPEWTEQQKADAVQSYEWNCPLSCGPSSAMRPT